MEPRDKVIVKILDECYRAPPSPRVPPVRTREPAGVLSPANVTSKLQLRNDRRDARKTRATGRPNPNPKRVASTQTHDAARPLL